LPAGPPPAVHPRDRRHVEVDEHDVETAAFELIEGLLAVPADLDLVTLVLEHCGAALPQCALVVDEEDLQPRFVLGSDRQERCEIVLCSGRGSFCTEPTRDP